ncbi:hypothetical protein PGT21_014979 [Puccinia graminis f. sp. tritici]|uniref:Uncharacterized protein n=1 Tax=Puccinia graminis f. sp. tritici TaxID=56615 RepID=A0A5B0P2B4_PUCGR|nr:hypothetical protein PGTUg99_020730 [Puccinia graminis f. sp. tritici]KAA1094248.1 hypothetical protein PGT21_014979 [Puccinia graminis f. sp. tritici]
MKDWCYKFIAYILIKAAPSNGFIYKWTLTTDVSSSLIFGNVHLGNARFDHDGLITVDMRVGTGRFSLQENENEENLHSLPYTTLNKPYQLYTPVGNELEFSRTVLYLHNLDLMTCGWTIYHDVERTSLQDHRDIELAAARRQRVGTEQHIQQTISVEPPSSEAIRTRRRRTSRLSLGRSGVPIVPMNDRKIPENLADQEIVVWNYRFSEDYAAIIADHNKQVRQDLDHWNGDNSDSDEDKDLSRGRSFLEPGNKDQAGFRIDLERTGPVGPFFETFKSS